MKKTVKCAIANCNKLINKKSPGLQCAKCSKWIHGSCANLTADQLCALYSTESADWKCRSCQGNTKSKRLSFIMPDAEEELDTDTEPQSQNQITQSMLREFRSEIRKEVRDVVRAELQSELQSVLQFYSNKIDDYETKIKEYENQSIEMKNQCKNLLLRNEAMEQKINIIEQNLINNYIEIDGISEYENEDVYSIAKKLSEKINQNAKDMLKVYRKKSKRNAGNRKSPIIISLAEGRRAYWLAAAKNIDMTCARDLGMSEDSKIYVRESLTPYTANLLWKAKTTLKKTDLCKYVWCSEGVVLARKADRQRIHHIRNTSDIERLAQEFAE